MVPCSRNSVVLLGLALIALPAAARPVAELDLVIPDRPLQRVIAEQIVELVDEESGLRINLVPLPDGFTSELDALEAGHGDIAFAPNNERYREGINTIIPLYPSILHVVTRADRPATNLRELLEGARVYAGSRGSVSWQVVEGLIADLELPPGAVDLTDAAGPVADVIVIYAPIDREYIMNEPSIQNMKWFSFGSPDDVGKGSAVDRAVLLNPRLRPFVIPIGTFGKLTPEPVVTVAVDNLLVARADLEDAVAYDLFAEILRQRPALFSARPELFQPVDENLASSNFAFSLHPGAVAFLKRDEPTMIERYSGVAEVVATLMVGIVSGVFAVVKIYRVRRKNRLDEFLVKVIDIRKTVTSGSSAGERVAAVDAIEALQDEAFTLLVDEKLAADESFRIFIELSRDAVEHIREDSAGESASDDGPVTETSA